MSTTILLTREHIYPAAAIISTFWVTLFQTIKVGAARKRAGIEYPQLYAEKAEVKASKDASIFNCTQRAHQNTLENLPSVLASTAILSLRHPLVAASICGIWSFSRVLYTIGYSTGNPARRNFFGAAAFSIISSTSLLLGSTWTLIELLRDIA
ncbi:uncharacterized protein FIBRA_00072 [Fibroporia radiculosa]|uniref:Glutathione transferase n=1 Tax=Fibroporia radiculosa TaxID=599839 RepID=J7SCF7_9APHY|nr:uncharacterized protein FIBRA_00072 [Fibroporia radiculosa]CCL98078.1 predicted protein [Fibroporia radiculosa]